MAEEPNKDAAQNPNGGPAPDEASLRRMIAEQVQQHMATQDKEPNVSLGDNQPQQPGYTPPQPTENPLKQILDPIYGPTINAARIDAAVARDASTFYASHPEALPHMAEIERIHSARIAQGVPDTHETVWNWYRGQNFDKFMKEAIEKDKTKVDAARDFADGGQGVRPTGGQVKDAFSSSDEELAGYLKDRPF